MDRNEQDFINYFYTNYVIDRKSTPYIVNQSYFILYGAYPTDGDCGVCVKSRLDRLKNKYISLSKVSQPVYLQDAPKNVAPSPDVILKEMKKVENSTNRKMRDTDFPDLKK